MSMLNKLTARLLLTLSLVCGAAPVMAAEVYHVTIDTSALAGTDGYLDFLLLGLSNAAPVQTQLSNFSGDYTASSFALGDTSGDIHSVLSIANSGAWNEYGQWTHFGGTLSFDISINNSASSGASSGAGTTLSIALLDAGLYYLGSSGDIVTIALQPGSASIVSADGAYATISAVPEPAAWLLLGAGLLLIGLRRRL
ncbi:PEP-CTERM sorting domain-containing protein [Duganella sp. FT80W]|uniref:PEP-CTERM sorting domain-containing protein n=1 Tax=Duganella guangzhouensis TaxID=2666084 RepID=A0A6I2L523_9BURK|nr:NF038129 family PEP-CTERM protein [Duganella guangzhouensis]MRW92287.1 PEP-CTERM sorting domain-containing protein [Duganella guangzhouensis]